MGFSYFHEIRKLNLNFKTDTEAEIWEFTGITRIKIAFKLFEEPPKSRKS